jgi:ubiquinone/menaquinone biosynthesis C-methylase UbiE
MDKLLMFFFFLTCYGALGQDQWKDVYRKNAWHERDQWQRADDLIKKLSLKKGSQAADIGCHEGYMTFKLADVVGETGNVFAVDVEQNKLDKLNEHIAEAKSTNITPIKGDYDNPKLPLNTLDAVIILDTYHEMKDHDQILQHIKASLKPGGRLLLCEPIAKQRKGATRAEQERKHELEMNYALEDLIKAGFKISFKQDGFVDREIVKGDKMWVVVATN